MLVKLSGDTMSPASDPDLEVIQSLENNKAYGCTLTILRKGWHHRKLFALLKLMYDQLPRSTALYNGEVVEQSFNRFRKEAVILAGHYHTDVTGNGDLRLEAVSLSYQKCPQYLAEEIYSDLIELALKKLSTYPDRESLNKIVEQLLEFT